jgi:hypothetical protein
LEAADSVEESPVGSYFKVGIHTEEGSPAEVGSPAMVGNLIGVGSLVEELVDNLLLVVDIELVCFDLIKIIDHQVIVRVDFRFNFAKRSY